MQQYLLTEDQKSLIAMVREFYQKEVLPIRAACDEEERTPMDVIQKAMEMGLHVLDIPEEYGGAGLDFQTYVMLIEEMCKVDDAFTSIINAGSIACKVVELGGTQEQKEHFYRKVVDGAFIGMCITEAGAGSDVSSIATTAVRDGDEYVLNGTKCFITNGALADMYIVFAYTDKSKGTKGISAFLVEKKHGVKVGKTEDKMGLKLSITSELIFDNVRIPASNLIGEEGRGFIYAMKALEKGRVTTMVHALGIAQAAMDIALDYARVRQTFGKPIIRHQGLAFLLADMQKRIDAARAMLYYSAAVIDRGLPLGTLSPDTKIFVSETAMSVTTDAVQVLGGYGYMKEYPVEKLMRDAKVFSIFEGTNQINLMVSSGILERQQ